MSNFSNASIAHARRRNYCNTQYWTLETFLCFDDTGEVLMVTDGEEEFTSQDGRNQENDRRNLGFMDRLGTTVQEVPLTPSGFTDARVLVESNRSGQIIYARRCICAQGGQYFCPIGAEICRVRDYGYFSQYFSRPAAVVKCEGKVQGLLFRYAWPLIAFVYLYLMCYLIGSQKGRYAIVFFRRLLFCWKEERYAQVLEDELRDRARRSFRRRNPPGSRNTSSQKVAASFRTTIYDEGTPQTECMICLGDFCRGDRVGDLRCGHVFHVNPCLKRWIERKNLCPLCDEPVAMRVSKPAKQMLPICEEIPTDMNAEETRTALSVLETQTGAM